MGAGPVEASRALYGRALAPLYDVSRARVIVDLDADLLDRHPLSLRYSRQFADGRRLAGGRREMNRLYVVESSFTSTGAAADYRVPVMARQVAIVTAALVRAVAQELGARAPLPEGLAARLDRSAAALPTGCRPSSACWRGSWCASPARA